jgi:Flp pilus assembly protein TadG
MMRRRGRGDRGQATLEFVLLAPLLIFSVFALVHLTLLWHAHNVITAVAQESARAARSMGATGADGEAKGRDVATQLGGGVLNVAVTVTYPATDTVTATASGDAPSIVPGLRQRVTASVSSPVEAFRP